MPELLYGMTKLNDADVMVAFYGPIRDYAFVWHGGAYIDVCFLSAMGSVRLNDYYYEYGCQCIGVYDYSKGETTITFGDAVGFMAEVREFLKNEMPMRTGD